METSLFRNETPAEYFKELVESAISRQGVEAHELTAFYLVNLLCGFVHLDRAAADGRALDAEPLAMRLGRALESGGAELRAGLRCVGDLSLFVSGFFADSLTRKIVDVDYYIALGGYAYGSLSRFEEDSFASVFAELAGKFMAFVDVLGEVSDRSALSTNADLLRLYEKWLRTGSRRDGQLLVERGIVPNVSLAGRLVQ